MGTPLTPQASNFPTTDFTDLVNTPTEINESNVQLEIGQEAVPITIHPLSPLQETIDNDIIIGNSKIHLDNSPINVNVWADSPGQITIGTTTIQHGTRLSLDDLERLKFMMSEFYLKSLLPYVERQIGLLNDVISNKKGVSRSLFSATKRWFGTSKPGVPGSVPANVVMYDNIKTENSKNIFKIILKISVFFLDIHQNHRNFNYEDWEIYILCLVFLVWLIRLIIMQNVILPLIKRGFIMPVHWKWQR